MNSSDTRIPTLLVSAVTGPMVLTLLTGQALATLFQELGELSEEIFRGDRLPLLEQPQSSSPSFSSPSAPNPQEGFNPQEERAERQEK